MIQIPRYPNQPKATPTTHQESTISDSPSFYLMNKKRKKKKRGRTFHGQLEGVALALSFDVGRQTGVDAGRLAIDALQHQTLVAHDDAGAAVLVLHLALQRPPFVSPLPISLTRPILTQLNPAQPHLILA